MRYIIEQICPHEPSNDGKWTIPLLRTTSVTKGKKNAPVADASKRDFENVPLVEDIDRYFDREVKPYNPEAWIDKSKTKVGYEIPFTRYFYK